MRNSLKTVDYDHMISWFNAFTIEPAVKNVMGFGLTTDHYNCSIIRLFGPQWHLKYVSLDVFGNRIIMIRVTVERWERRAVKWECALLEQGFGKWEEQMVIRVSDGIKDPGGMMMLKTCTVVSVVPHPPLV